MTPWFCDRTGCADLQLLVRDAESAQVSVRDCGGISDQVPSRSRLERDPAQPKHVRPEASGSNEEALAPGRRVG